MKYLSHNEIREKWINFFLEKNHQLYDSAPLVPINDNSLLWINAGVAPLKKYFDGSVVPSNPRIVNIQKCIRTNDIENVGITKRHHTFFEMMGNFSIGDYFREEAIEYAFELLTSDKWFGIDKELIYVTIYPSDEVAYSKWVELGLDESHIVRLEGNFWEIGDGPCGPDSEIFFDRGLTYDDGNAFEKFKLDEEQERYVEIWNNVFSQYNSESGKKREEYKELPSKNIDTGAGLERWCCIFQGVDSNFDTDLFKPMLNHLEEITGIMYSGQSEFKIIVDHIRTLVFALVDGACFENVGRGYVLRRLLRRSLRLGKKLGIEGPFMYKMVSEVVNTMSDAYPMLIEQRSHIEVIILEEENIFLKTLDAGEKRLNELMRVSSSKVINGFDAFKLYDTYGFPFELTKELVEESGYTVVEADFKKHMDAQRKLAKKSVKNKTVMASQNKVLLEYKDKLLFSYGIYRVKSNVCAIFGNEGLVHSLDHDGFIAIKRTCCYAESGGQVGDTGMLIGKNFKARIMDVFKAPNGQHIHKIKLLDGIIRENDEVEVVIDKDRRKDIEVNHSSVHLVQYALCQLIDKNIKQAGSYVSDEKFRFDFTCVEKIHDEDIVKIEDYVNKLIGISSIVATENMPIDKAKQMGAIALFDEKYEDIVRVVKIGKSVELCGGTHVSNINEIKKIAILSIESKGSNHYRIEGVTNNRVERSLFEIIKPYNDNMVKSLIKAREILDTAKNEGIELEFDITIDNSKPKSYKDVIFNKNEMHYISDEVKLLEKKYMTMKENKSIEDIDIYNKDLKVVGDVKYLITKVDNMDNSIIKSLADNLSNKDINIILFLNIKEDNSVNFICKSNLDKIGAGDIIKLVASITDGNGGGSKSFGQGGSKNSEAIDKAISGVEDMILNA